MHTLSFLKISKRFAKICRIILLKTAPICIFSNCFLIITADPGDQLQIRFCQKVFGNVSCRKNVSFSSSSSKDMIILKNCEFLKA